MTVIFSDRLPLEVKLCAFVFVRVLLSFCYKNENFTCDESP